MKIKDNVLTYRGVKYNRDEMIANRKRNKAKQDGIYRGVKFSL